MKARRWLAGNGFVVGILAGLALAWIWPEGGAKGGLLQTEWTAKVAVAAIFFVQGLVLPAEKLRAGLAHWRFHAFCLATGYLAIPAGVLGMLGALGLWPEAERLLPEDLRTGFLFFAVLPTTITSAVIYTAQARGHVEAAVFTTAFSNVAGIFVVPAVLIPAAGLAANGGGENSLRLLGNIALLLLAPMAGGQALRWGVRAWAEARGKALRQVNQYLVYFILYAAFADSFARNVWAEFAPAMVVLTGGLMGLILAGASAFAWMAPGWLGFATVDRKAALFCASQKTLAAGVPLAGTLFAQSGLDLSLILLPLMIYHPLQLILGGILADRLAGVEDDPPAGAAGKKR